MELQSTQLTSSDQAVNVQALPHALRSQKEQIVPQEEVAQRNERSGAGPVEQLVVGVEAAAAVYDRVGAVQNTRTAQAVAVEKSSHQLERDQAELQVTRELATRDREVRAHEQTHSAIGGAYAGSPTYSYTNGPDGRQYAVSGEVSIDTSAVDNDPQATIEKAEVIIRAALSVSEPSSADRQVAAEAKSLALQARAELIIAEEEQGEAPLKQVEQELLADHLDVEEQELEREELLASNAEKEEKNEQDKLDKEALRQRNEASIEVLREYNVKVSEIQETLRRLNLQLVDSGAFKKLFPEGFLIDKSV